MNSWSLVGAGAAVLLLVTKPEYAVRQSGGLTVITFVGAALLSKFIYSAILYPDFLSPIRDIPSPQERSWVTGSTNSYFLNFPGEMAREWVKSIPNNGLLRYYVIGNIERVLVVSPKALAEVLVTKSYDFKRPDFARIQLSSIIGHGLLTAEGDEHKTQRKGLMPSFAYRHIKDLYPVFWNKAVEMIRSIEEEFSTTDNVIQVRNWSSRAMLDVIGLAGMNYDVGSLKNPNNELSQKYRNIFTRPTVFEKLLGFLGLFVFGFGVILRLPTKRNLAVADAVDYIRTVSQKMVQEKKAILQRQETGGVDILSVALTSEVFSDENLVDQMMTFLAAGHETTSSALQWAVYAMCKYTSVQTRLREEVRANLPPIAGEDATPISAAVIDSLPYLNAFCNEVLRFYAPVPFTSRAAARDTVIAGHRIPKGTIILIAPEVVNCDEEFWGPDAGEFNPDRWLGQGKANSGGATSNYAFLTFIHGPRSCIGQGFAKSELACFVGAMVRRFEMELKDPNAELKIRSSVTMSPEDGVLVRLRVVK